MRIYTKILLATFPLAILILLAIGGIAYHFSSQALVNLAENCLEPRLSEALNILTAREQARHRPGSEKQKINLINAMPGTATATDSGKIGKRGQLFAVDSRGIIAMHPDTSLSGRNVNAEKWFQKIRNTEKGMIRYALQGTSYLARYAYFPAREWYVFAAVPDADVYKYARQTSLSFIFLAILGAAVMTLALRFVIRGLMAPLNLLITEAERIAQGDLEARISTHTQDELGRLSNAFDKIADKSRKTLNMLKGREKLFRSLIENASGIMVIMNADRIIRYGSPSVKRWLGFDSELLTGRSIDEFVHPDDLSGLIPLYTEKGRHSDPVSSECFRIRHKDGSWRIFEAVGRNLLNDPVVEGWIFNLREVTDRNQAQARLRESEEKYRNLFEFAPEGIIITTLDGDILSYNDAFMKILKIDDRNACPDLRADDLYANPRDRLEMTERIKREGQIENYEQDHVDRQGRVFPASRSLRLIQYEGKPCIQTIIRDVTQINEMKAELRNYAENLEKMVDEKTRELTSANQKLSSTIKSLEEAQEQLAVSAHQAGMAEIAVSVLHNIGNAVNSVNVRTSRLEESMKSQEIRSLEKIRDLLRTEWEPSNDPANIRKEKLLSFFSTIIDIFKNKNNNFKNDLEFIRNGVNHIMEIIAIQQKYAGLRGYETQVNLNDLLEDSVEMLTDSFRKRDIQVDFNLEPLPDILLDKSKMMQIFINILKNAYEAIDMGSAENKKQIRMSSSVEKGAVGAYVQIMIADTGAGLSPDVRQEAFRFNFSTKGRGTGYGLHDSSNYVRAQGGSIDLLSEGPGKGACLVVKLPILQ